MHRDALIKHVCKLQTWGKKYTCTCFKDKTSCQLNNEKNVFVDKKTSWPLKYQSHLYVQNVIGCDIM